MAVIYLAWLPYGIEHFRVFINSYIKYDASCPHQLIIVFNGLAEDHPNKPEEYLLLLENNFVKIHSCIYFQSGQDIEIYKQVAATIDTEHILFLNTYSELMAANWLKHYVENFNEKTGIIGASGSFQSHYSSVFQKHAASWDSARGFLYNFRKYKLFIKAFLYWRFLFRPFPNPTIRTNAFMVRRNEFLVMRNLTVDTKFKAYQFESGRGGLTEFYRRKGLETLVIDKYGKTYEPSNWKQSSTFWINNQENLLVSDNQTRIYTQATIKEKKEMTRLAWGEV